MWLYNISIYDIRLWEVFRQICEVYSIWGLHEEMPYRRISPFFCNTTIGPLPQISVFFYRSGCTDGYLYGCYCDSSGSSCGSGCTEWLLYGCYCEDGSRWNYFRCDYFHFFKFVRPALARSPFFTPRKKKSSIICFGCLIHTKSTKSPRFPSSTQTQCKAPKLPEPQCIYPSPSAHELWLRSCLKHELNPPVWANLRTDVVWYIWQLWFWMYRGLALRLFLRWKDRRF